MNESAANHQADKKKPKRYANALAGGTYRNQKCICGSGKKTKKCHGVKLIINQEEKDEIDFIYGKIKAIENES